LLLLGADLVFLGLHVHASLQAAPDPLFLLDTDGGHAERFQYAKEAGTVILLGLVCLRTRQIVFGVWTVLFAYLLCDDALRIHEELGEAIARTWHYVPAWGLNRQALGELTLAGLVGVALLAPLAFFDRRAEPDSARASRDLALLLGVLVFFGVLVDALHSMRDGFPVRGLTILEEWGEMVTMSAIVCYVLHLIAAPVRLRHGERLIRREKEPSR
jgi:hypothetical protein